MIPSLPIYHRNGNVIIGLGNESIRCEKKQKKKRKEGGVVGHRSKSFKRQSSAPTNHNETATPRVNL